LPPPSAAYIGRTRILLRHGQSEFNLHFTATKRDPGIVDAPLTELGHTQAAEAAAALADAGIKRIIASPYTRALQTAEPLARTLGLPVLVTPAVRERYKFACDIGTPRTALEQAWPMHDFSAIEEIWWPNTEEHADQVVDRARGFRETMAALPDWSDTLVVSHWGFILTMTGQSVMNGTWLRCDPTEVAPDALVWRP
jgi:glucosyl-3-phosphoglycerate phosphatase